MFGLWKKRPKPEFEEIRRTMFGDVPLEQWRAGDGKAEAVEPWSGFAAARTALASGHTQSAIAALRKVSEIPNLESRQLLQSWHFLRQLGVQPGSEEAKLGVALW